MSIINQKIAGLLLLFGIVLILISGVILQYDFASICGVLFFYTLGVFFLYKPLEGFCALLFFRINIDTLSSRFHIQIRDDFSLNLAAIFGIAMVILTALYFTHQAKTWRSLPLPTIPFSLLIILFGMSISYSLLPFVTLQEVLRVISIFCVFMVAVSLGKTYGYDAYSKIIFTIILAGIIPLTLALLQLFTGGGLTDTTGFEGRLFGTFVHPNTFAAFLIILFGILLHRITIMQYDEKFITKGIHRSTTALHKTLQRLSGMLLANQKLLYALLSATTVILVLTFSRGGWLALIVMLSVYSFLRAPKVLLLMLFIIITLFFASDVVHDRIEEIYNPPADSSIRWRVQQWQDVIAAWQASPVLGYGAGTEVAIHEREQGFFAGNPYTHNDFLKILQENGIVGVILYTLLVITTLIALIKKQRGLPIGIVQSFIFIVTLIFVAEVIFGLSSNIWRGTALQWLLWTLIGLALSLGINTNESKDRNDHQRIAS